MFVVATATALVGVAIGCFWCRQANAPRVYQPIGFNLLRSFKYDEDQPRNYDDGVFGMNESVDQIPVNVRKLDGADVSIDGFMIPCDVDHGRTTNFILCWRAFGSNAAGIRMNDWIWVTLPPGDSVRVLNDARFIVKGRLSVGEKWGTDGVESIYRLEATEVNAPLDE